MVSAVKGTNDIFPGAGEVFLDSGMWEHIFAVAAEVLGGFGYHRVWLPVFEETALFARGIGSDSDIVAKEMYTFADRGGRSLTLRPEATAGAVRAYVEHNLGRTDPVQRWWYGGPMFRAERPQKGRYRQFYQVGAELFGVADPTSDAEMLLMLTRFCAALGLADTVVRLNSLGDAASRSAYREALTAYLRHRIRDGEPDTLCEPCTQRLDTNPLRILDCKRPGCRALVADAPDIAGYFSDAAQAHFAGVTDLLGQAGVTFVRDKRLVRGLDYYTGTIFEITTGALGAQDAVCGGGRYDALVSLFGGPATPAVGFAAGVERMALLLAQQNRQVHGPDLYLVPLGERMGRETMGRAFVLADAIRRAGSYRVEVDLGAGRLKNRLRRGDKVGARCALVLGEDEIAGGRGKLKSLRFSGEIEVMLDGESIANALGEMLRRR